MCVLVYARNNEMNKQSTKDKTEFDRWSETRKDGATINENHDAPTNE